MRTAFEREGDIRSVDLAAAFATLWRARATGVLAFERSDHRVRFDILDGAVVGASTSDPSFDAAEVLVRGGKLDPAALAGRKLGRDRARAAREQGLVTERDWRWGEKIRTVEILSDLLGWLEGRYSFDAVRAPAPGEFRVGIERLLLELFLRSRDREFIHRSLGEADAPLQRAADFDEAFPGLGLTPDAQAVVAAIDGRATAAEICRRIPPDPFSVEKLLAALTTLGLVHPEYAAVGPPPPPEIPAARSSAVRAQPPTEAGGPPPSPPPPEEPLPPDAEWGMRDEEEPLSEEQPVELPLAPSPEPSEPEPVVVSWEQVPAEPMDQSLSVPEPPDLIRTSRPGLSSAWLLVVLALALGALLLFRSREKRPSEPPAASVAATTTPTVPRAAVPVSRLSPRAGTPRAATPTGAQASPFSPTAAVSRPTAAQTGRRKPVPTARPSAVPTPRATAAGESAPPDRRPWLARAARDRRVLGRDHRTRYTIQLELVCELSSLQEAWRYDRRGAMWLLAVTHRGRDCFRVLWGRYATLAEARSAKAALPRFFFTTNNQPAVVSTRGLLP